MSVLVPGVTPEQQRATIAKLQVKLNALLTEVDAKFAGRSFTAAEVGAEILRVQAIVNRWYVIQYGDTLDRVRRYFFTYDREKLVALAALIGSIGDIQDFMTAVELGYSRDEGYPPEYVFTSKDQQWHNLYRAERAPIEWLLGTAPPTLANFVEWNEALTTAAETAANIPSITLKWLLEQLFKSFNLPTWFVPAVGITALVGVGAWAYFSFLAPVGAAGKYLRLRKNPGRRRRRVQRRLRS